MTELYDPLRGKDRTLLVAIMSKLYEEPDRPIDLALLEASVELYSTRTVRQYVAALCSMGAARRPIPVRHKKPGPRLLWPTVLGRLWWREDLDGAPNLFAELDELDETPLDVDDGDEPY